MFVHDRKYIVGKISSHLIHATKNFSDLILENRAFGTQIQRTGK